MERVAAGADPPSVATLDRVRIQTPEKKPDVGDIVAAGAVGDAAYVHRMRSRIEGGYTVGDTLAGVVVAQIDRAAPRWVHPCVAHVLVPAEPLEKFHHSGIPPGHVAR